MKKVIMLCICWMMCLSLMTTVSAKNKITTICDYTSFSHYEKIDINGDHKKERVGLNVTATQVKISIGRKFKATLKKEDTDQAKLDALTIGKRHYLVLTIGENDGVSEAVRLYQISKKFKLTNCGDLAKYATKHFSSAIDLSVVKWHNDSFEVEDTIEPNETGLMTLTYTFQIKDHSLKRTSNYGKVRLLNRKSLKVYTKQLSLNDSPTSSKVSALASKGDVFTPIKFYEKKGKMALLLKKGDEQGWLKLTTSVDANTKLYKDHPKHGLFYNTGNYFGA